MEPANGKRDDEVFRLLQQVEELSNSLSEARETLRAIRGGEVDAIVVSTPRGPEIYTLRGADQAYRLMIESMAEGAITLASDGLILYCNRQFADMLRVPMERVNGHSILDFCPASERRLLEAVLEQGQTRHVREEVRLARSDGETVPVHLSVNRLPAEEPPIYSVIVGDLTGQKEREAIAANEKLARSILEQAVEAILVCDREGRIIRASQAAWRLCGCNPVLRRFEEAFPLFPAGSPGDRPEAREGLHPFTVRSILAGEVLETEETTFHRPDGEIFTLLLGAGPLRDDDGNTRGCIVTLTDITGRRSLEEQLRHSQRLESMGRLAGGVAHEFNNLMTVVTGYSEILLSRLNPLDPLRAEVEQIKRSGERATVLTRQLLAFSRKQMLSPKVINLNETVSRMERMLRKLIGEHIELVTVAAPDLGKVKADPGQLEQVIVNLAVNARDAMPQGGRLLIETTNATFAEEGPPEHPVFAPGAYVLLTVSDTGHGMDRATLGRIFEPFFTTKEAGQGTGLGLPMAYGIVKQSGGRIFADSEPGRGTTFKIYMPAVTGREEDPDAQSDERKAPRGRETILVAEDEETVRSLVKVILEDQGYTVVEAGNGEEALRRIHERAVHLLLTDVVMPGMGGPELASRLQAEHPGIRILFMSGYMQSAVIPREVLRPGTGFLQKPFSHYELGRKVRELLDMPEERRKAG